MSITLSPVSSVYSPVYSPVSSVYSPVYSPVSSIYNASTNYPYMPKTSLPISSTQDVVITSDYPLVFNKDKDNLTVAPIYPYTYPTTYPYNNPAIVVPYENLNKNPEVINRLVKYFYYKVLDDYLYDELSGLLKYLKVSNNKVHIIKNEDDRDKENISQEEADKKVEYIEHEIFDKDDMYEILMKISNETDIELIKLPKNEYIIQGYVKKFLKKEFNRIMNK
jgi:hypothetical protein